MRKFSKYLIMLIIFNFLAFSSCSKENEPKEIIGSWVVSHYIIDGEKITKKENTTWTNVNNGDITIQFEELDSNDIGILNGITVTNEFSGKYTISSKGEFSVTKYGGTSINEPDWTNNFQLYKIEKFKVKFNDLFLYFKDNEDIIVLNRE